MLLKCSKVTQNILEVLDIVKIKIKWSELHIALEIRIEFLLMNLSAMLRKHEN